MHFIMHIFLKCGDRCDHHCYKKLGFCLIFVLKFFFFGLCFGEMWFNKKIVGWV